MEIFDLKNNNVVIHPAAYILKPFKVIWDGDKSKSKKQALKELAFIYYSTDFKSDFSDIINDNERCSEVKKIVELPEDWTPNDKILDAIKFYKERQRTASMDLLDSALIFTQKLKTFYETVNLDERDEKTGKLIHNPTMLQKGIAELANQTDSIRKLKEAVSKEIAEASRVRGGGEIGLFEDPE